MAGKMFGNFPLSFASDTDFEIEAAKVFLGKKRGNLAVFDCEAGLFKTKWYDYRGIHYLAATAWYAECFKREYGKAVVRWIDHQAGTRTGLAAHSLFDLSSMDITALVKGRQAADEMGIPYEVYLRAALDRGLLNGNARMPRPSQLYSQEMREAAASHWLEETHDRLYLPRDPFYSAVNYRGHPDQDDYYAWLGSKLRQRAAPQFALCRMVFSEQILPAVIAERDFPEQFAKALEIWQEK